MLLFQNKGMAAMMVYKANPPGIELNFYILSKSRYNVDLILVVTVLYFGWQNQPSSGTMRVYIGICSYVHIYSKWMLT